MLKKKRNHFRKLNLLLTFALRFIVWSAVAEYWPKFPRNWIAISEGIWLINGPEITLAAIVSNGGNVVNVHSCPRNKVTQPSSLLVHLLQQCCSLMWQLAVNKKRINLRNSIGENNNLYSGICKQPNRVRGTQINSASPTLKSNSGLITLLKD